MAEPIAPPDIAPPGIADVGATDRRLTVTRLGDGAGAGDGDGARRPSFAEDIAAGLSRHPKSLQPKYFYDQLGSLLFDAVCVLPEYYPTRTESAILETHAAEIVAAMRAPVRLLELGSGSSTKTRHLLEALLARQERLEYTPIDISESALVGSSERLLRAFPRLTISGFVGDFRDARPFSAAGAADGGGSDGGGSVLALFLGSTIGNFERPQQRELLAAVRRLLAPGDALLLGTDLVKGEEILVPAYDDALGVTAAFNLNLLVRINRELGGAFEPRRFAHRAVWNPDEGRIEISIVSRERQVVPIRALDLEVAFEPGEAILTEYSHKFRPEQVAELAAAAGFRVEQTWTDERGWFASNLLRAA